jgi:ABC-type Zn uptake system ZnuABC Zn-binding protein ZnuA
MDTVVLYPHPKQEDLRAKEAEEKWFVAVDYDYQKMEIKAKALDTLLAANMGFYNGPQLKQFQTNIVEHYLIYGMKG